jgi:hypothetical protein
MWRLTPIPRLNSPYTYVECTASCRDSPSRTGYPETLRRTRFYQVRCQEIHSEKNGYLFTSSTTGSSLIASDNGRKAEVAVTEKSTS